MKVEEIQQIRAIASIVRNELLPLATEAGLYPRLTGACAICSTVLYIVLVNHGYQAEIILGRFEGQEEDEAHAFVRVENWIVDITAVQFGKYPEVFMTPFVNKKYEKLLAGDEAQAEFDNWDILQRPRTYKKKLVRIVKSINNKLVEYKKVG